MQGLSLIVWYLAWGDRGWGTLVGIVRTHEGGGWGGDSGWVASIWKLFIISGTQPALEGQSPQGQQGPARASETPDEHSVYSSVGGKRMLSVPRVCTL